VEGEEAPKGERGNQRVHPAFRPAAHQRPPAVRRQPFHPRAPSSRVVLADVLSLRLSRSFVTPSPSCSA